MIKVLQHIFLCRTYLQLKTDRTVSSQYNQICYKFFIRKNIRPFVIVLLTTKPRPGKMYMGIEKLAHNVWDTGFSTYEVQGHNPPSPGTCHMTSNVSLCKSNGDEINNTMKIS